MNDGEKTFVAREALEEAHATYKGHPARWAGRLRIGTDVQTWLVKEARAWELETMGSLGVPALPTHAVVRAYVTYLLKLDGRPTPIRPASGPMKRQ